MKTANQVRACRFLSIAYLGDFNIFLSFVQVMSVLSGSPVFSINSYSSHVAREREEVPREKEEVAREREEVPRQLLHCGVTPTFEKVVVWSHQQKFLGFPTNQYRSIIL